MSLFDQNSLFGIYVHIPYCLQRCTYCDFATYVHTEILPAEKYVEILKKEIAAHRHWFKYNKIDTLYFGGGTPSLLPAELIVSIINELKKYFEFSKEAEVTIEINPATVDPKKLDVYLQNGINRFSVGAQTFSDKHLKNVHREHNAKQTLETLSLLQSRGLNYSFDLLFALPNQTLDELRYDLEVATDLGMKHISPYYLTVPEGHPLSHNRPLEPDQLEMFDLIDKALVKKGFDRYEISNYAIKGFESQHNLLYWTDHSYWGIGLSSHSYLKQSQEAAWGSRFWNPSNIKVYESFDFGQKMIPYTYKEVLEKHQSLTDFCHTSLRLIEGLNFEKTTKKFGPEVLQKLQKIADPLIERSLLISSPEGWKLSSTGLLISNQIFEEFTFLKEDF